MNTTDYFMKVLRTDILMVEHDKDRSHNLQSFLHQNILRQAVLNQMVLLQHRWKDTYKNSKLLKQLLFVSQGKWEYNKESDASG